MVIILKKEFLGFFSSFLGVGIMLVLFVAMGLFTWVLDGNLLDFGFAEMSVFFDMIPWFFLLFIPSLTMRLYAEEKENHSIDLIRILPVSSNQIILGKVLGAFAVVFVILLPTLLYVYSIQQLASDHSVDFSIVVGQYVAILLLCLTFIQISFLSSLFTNKQSVAFVVSLVCNFICWEGFLYLKSIMTVHLFDFDNLALKPHFNSLSLGVIRLSEVLFFLGLNVLLFAIEVLKFDRK